MSVALCAGALLGASPAPETRPLEGVYLDGQVVRLDVAGGPKPVLVGPWRIGARVQDPKPRDQRLNLYLVAPGAQYHLDGGDEFDHNVIVNAVPDAGMSRQYDVYWALVLDPRLHTDFKGEKQLLLAAQASFAPGDLFEFDDIPADAFLRAFLRADTLADLAQYRRKGGALPRILILPAGFAVTASSPAAAPDTATTTH
jgi:hypothetical protein